MKQIKGIFILGITILLVSLIFNCEGNNTNNIVKAEEHDKEAEIKNDDDKNENEAIEKKENSSIHDDRIDTDNRENDPQDLTQIEDTEEITDDKNDTQTIDDDRIDINNDEKTDNADTSGDTETDAAVTGDAVTGDAVTGDAETGDAETDAAVTGDAETGDAETGDAETDAAETDAAETDAAVTGAAETGDAADAEEFRDVIEDKKIENDAVINPYTKGPDNYFFDNKSKWRTLNYNVLEQGSYSTSVHLDFFAFSREGMFETFYKDLKGLPRHDMNANPGVNFDFNLGIVLTTGERYVKGSNINVTDVRFNGKAIYVYFNETQPEDTPRRTLVHPFTVASIYFDKEVRKDSKLISFINDEKGILELSAPIVETKRYPYYEIPEKLNVYPVEKGDYGNFTEEKYMAFTDHISFNSSYVDLKENTEYKVRPPKLNFLGNVVVMMSYGEKGDGGYEINTSSAYSNVYIFGEAIYIMVRKKKPTDETIRYYDITRPYSIASIQVGIKAKYLKRAVFIDEFTGDILTEQKIEYIKRRRRRY